MPHFRNFHGVAFDFQDGGDDTLDLVLDDGGSGDGEDGNKGGNVEYEWAVEEGETAMALPELTTRDDGADTSTVPDTSTAADDVFIDGNIIPAESYDAW